VRRRRRVLQSRRSAAQSAPATKDCPRINPKMKMESVKWKEPATEKGSTMKDGLDAGEDPDDDGPSDNGESFRGGE
jgi:hypothetical protein